MFERFAASARAAVDDARLEAIAFGHEELGPEHLLLGILTVESVATEVLTRHGVTIEGMRAEIERATPRRADGPPSVPFSSGARRVFEMALLEAKRLRRTSIGTEHLVLAILRDPTNLAARLLVDGHGLAYDVLWQELGGLTAAPPPTRPFLQTPIRFPREATTMYRRRHLVADVQALVDENTRLRALLRAHGIDPDAGAEPA